MVSASQSTAGSQRGPYAGAAERRAAIVDAAFKVFAEHGYTGGSLQKIADTVGMSQTNLLYYFRTKSELLLAVLKKRDEVAMVALPDDAEERPFVDAILGQARANETIHGLIELYTVLAGEAVTQGNPGRDYISQRLTELRCEFTGRFRELADAGRLKPGIAPDAAAASLIGMWDGLQLQWLLDPRAIDVVECLRLYLDQIVLAEASED